MTKQYSDIKVRKGQNKRLLSWLDAWGKTCTKTWFMLSNQFSFLGYYGILAVYSITNLVLLMLAMQVSVMQAAGVAFVFTSCAIINELIDMMVTVNPRAHYYRSWFPESQWFWAIPSMVVAGFITIGLSVYEIYCRTSNMVAMQLQSLKQYAMHAPLWAARAYHRVAVTTAVAYLLTNALNLTHKFLVTNVFSGADKQVDTKPEPEHDIAHHNPLFAKDALLSRLLRWYVSNPVVTFVGSMAGASLYAIGDSMQMSSLFGLLAGRGILTVPAVVSLPMITVFFVCTMVERLSIWGYNFHYFSETTVRAQDKRAFERAHKNPVIDLMQQDPNVRMFFTYGRIMMVCVLDIAGGLLHFTGLARFIGVLTSIGYCLQQRIQLSFQVNDHAKSTNKSAALSRVYHGVLEAVGLRSSKVSCSHRGCCASSDLLAARSGDYEGVSSVHTPQVVKGLVR